MSHIDTCVRFISHEIILPSHLSRNPLHIIVKSYCKTTPSKAAHRTFLRGECIAGQSLPTWYIQWGIPHKLYINMLSTRASWHKLHMPSRRIIGYIGISQNTTHPKIHAKLILSFQTSFKYRLTINTACLTCNHWVLNSIIFSINNKLSSSQNIPPQSEGANDCEELEFKNCSLPSCHIDHLI